MADPFDFDGPPKKTGAQKFGPMAILSALLPIAMAKGGREGVAGLMQGFQSAMQRKQQEQQQQQRFGLQQQRYQTEQDRYATEQDYRQRQEARQGRLDERQGSRDQFERDKAASDFWSKFMAEVPTWESPDVARQRVGAWAEGGSLLGIPAGRFESHALQMATPDRLKVRAIRNKWASMSADDKKMAHQGQGMSMRLNPNEPPVPYALWAPIVGGLEDPATGKAPQAAEKPPADAPLDRAHLSASVAAFREREGREPNPPEVMALIEQTKKAVGQADDRPITINTGVQDQRRFNMEQRLVAQWDKANAPQKEMRRALGLMETGLKRFRAGDKNGGSQAILVTFQKILDPTSVVRETEYARSAHGVSMLARMQGYADRLAEGGAGVPDAELAAMVQTGREMFGGMASYNDGLRQRLNRTASEYQLDPRMIFDDALTGSEVPPPTDTTSPQGAPVNPFRR